MSFSFDEEPEIFGRLTPEERGRVTRPGGSFICHHLPNRLSWIEALSRMRHPGRPAPEPACPGYHRYRFDAGQIRAMRAAAGLPVVELRAYGVLPRNPLVALPAPCGHRARWRAPGTRSIGSSKGRSPRSPRTGTSSRPPDRRVQRTGQSRGRAAIAASASRSKPAVRR